MNITLIIVGVYFIALSLMLSTENVQSAFVMKVVPFFSGLFCIFYAVTNMGIININL